MTFRLTTAAIIATTLAGAASAAGLPTPAPVAKTGPYGCALEQIPGSNAYQRADPTCLAGVAEGAFDSDVAEAHRN